MKEKILLILFGLVIGLGMIGLSYPMLKKMADNRVVPDGSEFESVEDLRAALSPDAIKKDKKVTLRDLLVPHPSDLIMYELAPNLDLKFQRANVKTNSHGMRDVERSLEPGDNVYRIALLGDSFAFAWGVEYEEGFGAVLERELNEKTDNGITYEVLNFGTPGYSTFQEVEHFLDKGIAFQPDAVLIFAVENDFGLPFFIKNFDQEGKLVVAQKFHKMSESERKKTVKDAIDPNNSLKKLEKVCKERDIKIFFAINPNKKAQDVGRGFWYVKESKYIKKIPLRKDFLKAFYALNVPEESLSLSFDPHPSPLKHRLMGELLAHKLIKLDKL